jgi:hypothetical protein
LRIWLRLLPGCLRSKSFWSSVELRADSKAYSFSEELATESPSHREKDQVLKKRWQCLFAQQTKQLGASVSQWQRLNGH